VCDLETSRMGAPYIYNIIRLKVNDNLFLVNPQVQILMHFTRGFIF